MGIRDLFGRKPEWKIEFEKDKNEIIGILKELNAVQSKFADDYQYVMNPFNEILTMTNHRDLDRRIDFIMPGYSVWLAKKIKEFQDKLKKLLKHEKNVASGELVKRIMEVGLGVNPYAEVLDKKEYRKISKLVTEINERCEYIIKNAKGLEAVKNGVIYVSKDETVGKQTRNNLGDIAKMLSDINEQVNHSIELAISTIHAVIKSKGGWKGMENEYKKKISKYNGWQGTVVVIILEKLFSHPSRFL